MHVEALAWYDHWLKGRDTGILEGPRVRYVVPGTRADGTDGSDDWRVSETWPPASTPLDLHLRADGVLGDPDVPDASRSYLYMPATAIQPKNANPPTLPNRLEWTTPVFGSPIEFAGDIRLELDAAVSAPDTAWIAVLYDVAPDGSRSPITAGWMRASHRGGDTVAEPVPSGQHGSYSVPIVPNARHLAAGHALTLALTSSDVEKNAPTVMAFRHTPTGDASVNTIHASSRLVLPAVTRSAAITS